MGEMYCTTGYHKAECSYAEIVKKWQRFKISRKDIEWLGDGIYFWENLSDAHWWRKDAYKHFTIFRAELCCKSKYYFDLDDKKNMDEMRKFAEACKDAFLKSGKDVSGDSFIYRAAVCSYYKERVGIKLMRFTFPQNEYNSLGFPIDVVYRTQYCATDNSVIKHFEVLEEG